MNMLFSTQRIFFRMFNSTYIIKEHSHEFEVSLGPVPVDNAVSLLAHEKQQRDAQVSIHQCLAKTLG